MRSSIFWDVTQRIPALITVVSEKPIASWTPRPLQDGTDRLPQNVANYQSALTSQNREDFTSRNVVTIHGVTRVENVAYFKNRRVFGFVFSSNWENSFSYRF